MSSRGLSDEFEIRLTGPTLYLGQGVSKMSHLQQNSRTLPFKTDSTHPFPGIELPEDYNMHEVPWTDDGGPVKVNFSINLSSILAIDEPKQVLFLFLNIFMYIFLGTRI